MYHRSSGRLLEKLEGHGEGCINAVAWHPTNVAMLASCSDDGTVRIWGPGSAQSGYTRIHSSIKATRQERQVHSDDSDPTPFPWAMSPVPPSEFPAPPELQSSSDEDEDEAMEEAV
jgi:WD repeat-containing protein 26